MSVVVPPFAVPAPLYAQIRVPSLAAAESALVRGDAARALRLATGYVNAHRDDPRGWQLRGRAATTLGGSEGERIGQASFEQALALDPTDRDAWEGWLVLAPSPGDRARMRRALAHEVGAAIARARLARLLIDDERYDSANALLGPLIREDSAHPGVLALRAQSAFESGDAVTGDSLYAGALRHAARDDDGVLWSQMLGIASPVEREVWDAGIQAPDRPGFFAAFWGRRDPDLFAGTNRRIAEHFTRLRHVRRLFPLLHPLAAARAADSADVPGALFSRGERLFYLRCERWEHEETQILAARRSGAGAIVADTWARLGAWRREWALLQRPGVLAFAPERPERTVGEPFLPGADEVTPEAARRGSLWKTGLDDRGLTYLRLGPPAGRVSRAPNQDAPYCRAAGAENWEYPGLGEVRFLQPTSLDDRLSPALRHAGDFVFRPLDEEQVLGTIVALTRDVSSVHAPLPFGFWYARFRDPGDASAANVFVFATRDRIASQLVGAMSVPGEPARATGGGVMLRAPAGLYTLRVHALSGDSLGREVRSVDTRSLGAGPALSDLLLAAAWPDTVVTRDAMLLRTPRDLVLSAGARLRAFAEIYGVPASADGRVRFRATYELLRTDDVVGVAERETLPGAMTVTFDREASAEGGIAREWLDLTPTLPPGRCFLRLTIRDPVTERLIGRTLLAFDLVDR